MVMVKLCTVCGTSFSTVHPTKRTCSHDCSIEWKNRYEFRTKTNWHEYGPTPKAVEYSRTCNACDRPCRG